METIVLNEEEIAVFGCGKAGKKVSDGRKSFKILFFVDNDEKRWGISYRGIPIFSPDKLREFTGKILIAVNSGDIVDSIAKQLKDMGINEQRILLYIGKDNDDFDIIPYNPLSSEIIKKNPVFFDQLKQNEDEKNADDKVAIFAFSYSIYVVQLIKNIKERKPYLSISLIAKSKDYYDDIRDYVDHIYLFQTIGDVLVLISNLPRYNVFQLLDIDELWIYFKDFFKEKCNRLCLMMKGSDFYRASAEERERKRKLIQCVDIMGCHSDDVKKDFLSIYPEVIDKIAIARYGLEVIKSIAIDLTDTVKNEIRSQFHLPCEKLIVTCGHNSSKAHQHIEIIQAISQIDKIIRNKAFFVFPMTYGDLADTYLHEVEDMLNQNEIDHLIMTDFMSFNEMGSYAEISDVMIHVQTTDAISSTMLEEMYAGSVVIAGSWLPYKWLREEGIYFETVDDINEITDMLSNIILNFSEYKEKCKNNHDIVYKLSSWDHVSDQWFSMWGLSDTV